MDILEKPEFTILAFDIETTKEPLKFPDAELDSIILISYVIDEETFLIVNREICSQDIQEFNYSPTKEINCDVNIFNISNEKECIIKFIEHIKLCQSLVLTTFNGDFFDIPFIKRRAEINGINLE